LAGIALVVLAAALFPPDRLLAAYAGRDFTPRAGHAPIMRSG
jgi:hypothetical protein